MAERPSVLEWPPGSDLQSCGAHLQRQKLIIDLPSEVSGGRESESESDWTRSTALSAKFVFGVNRDEPNTETNDARRGQSAPVRLAPGNSSHSSGEAPLVSCVRSDFQVSPLLVARVDRNPQQSFEFWAGFELAPRTRWSVVMLCRV